MSDLMMIPISAADMRKAIHESIRVFLLDSLPYDRKNIIASTQIEKMDAENLLVIWFNYQWRKISKRPRNIYISKEIYKNPLLKKHIIPFMSLLSDIEKGICLRKYQSRSIYNIFNINSLNKKK